MSSNIMQSNSNILVNTIPLPKLTTMLNDFIVKTVSHLNKLSVHVENKLSAFDHKLREIDIMVSLLESKLNSLPVDITSKYPPLIHCSLNDINPEFNQASSTAIENIKVNTESSTNKDLAVTEVVKVEENITSTDAVNTEPIEETPEQKLKSFLEKNNSEELEKVYKMLKFGIPEQAVYQKAKLTGYDIDIINNLIELYKIAYPNPSY